MKFIFFKFDLLIKNVYGKIRECRERKYMKNKIIELLQKGQDMSLSNIQLALNVKNKPAVSYHLRGLLDKGIVQKTENKTYKLTEVAGLAAEKMESIIIPCITAKAGPSDNVISESVTEIEMDSTKIPYKPNNLVIVKVSGTSMMPTFKDGDLLLFRKSQDRPRNNEIVLWRVDDGAKIKRIKWAIDDTGEPYGLLLSDNIQDEENKPIKITDDNSSFIGIFVSKINE